MHYEPFDSSKIFLKYNPHLTFQIEEEISRIERQVSTALFDLKIDAAELEELDQKVNEFLSDLTDGIEEVTKELALVEEEIKQLDQKITELGPKEVVDTFPKKRSFDKDIKTMCKKLFKTQAVDVVKESDPVATLAMQAYEERDRGAFVPVEKFFADVRHVDSARPEEKMRRLKHIYDDVLASGIRIRLRKKELKASAAYQLMQTIAWTHAHSSDVIFSVVKSTRQFLKDRKRKLVEVQVSYAKKVDAFN